MTVLPNDGGLLVLNNGVSSVCADGVSCSLAYSVQATPQLASVEVSNNCAYACINMHDCSQLVS